MSTPTNTSKWLQEAKLTWHAPSTSWRKRKKVNGKSVDFYYKHPCTEAGYRAAWKEWKEQERQLADLPPEELPWYLTNSMEYRKWIIQWFVNEQDEDDPLCRRMKKELGQLKALSEKPIKPTLEQLWKKRLMTDMGSDPEIRKNIIDWIDRIDRTKAHHGWSKERHKEKLVGGNSEKLIASRLLEVEHGMLSPGHWDTLARHIRYFVRWFGEDRSVDEITGQTLFDYRDYLLGLRATGSDALGDEWLQFQELYLADAPRTMATKHYDSSREKQTFFEALAWLEKHLGIDELDLL
jgi:hypothetical protein